MKEPIIDRFCTCIKKVQKSLKDREEKASKGKKGKKGKKDKTRKQRESIAIPICIKSVLQSKGRTLKRFRCRDTPFLQTQPIKLYAHSNKPNVKVPSSSQYRSKT